MTIRLLVCLLLIVPVSSVCSMRSTTATVRSLVIILSLAATLLLQPVAVIGEDDTLRFKSHLKKQPERVKRVIGGQEVSVGQYPWLVSVRGRIPMQMISYFAVKYSDVYCGGSIINKRWIITAAHCFSVPGIPKSGLQNVDNWYVKAGSNRLSFTTGQRLCAIWNSIRRVHDIHCWYTRIEKIIVHPAFNQQDNWLNDVALIKIADDLPLASSDQTVGAIPLPLNTNASWPSIGTTCSIQGWGCIENGGGLQQVARSVNIPILNDDMCSQIILPTIGPTRLCAGYQNNNVGLCKGDSGGGLVCVDKTDMGWRLAGIASFTSSTNPGEVPGVFTRVSAYIPWINTTISSN